MSTAPVVLDFETYYDPKAGYSLRKMSIEQYVLDARFQVHGCTVLDEGAGLHAFLPLPEFRDYLKARPWNRLAVLSHNARFDMAILSWVFGVMPGAYIDTLSIANVYIKPYTGRVSLEDCCKHLGIPGKDQNVLKQCEGLLTEQIRNVPGLWQALAGYAVGDGEKALSIWREHWRKMNNRERLVMDWSIRNYVRGRLRIDTKLLYENLHREETQRKLLLAELGLDSPAVLRSTKAFADHLLGLGVDVEYKPNSKGEDIPQFARDDDFMRACSKHPDPRVRVAIKGRMAFQSNLEVTRTKRLLDMANATKGIMLVPLNYCAAHTGRFGGAESINVQNLKKETPDQPAMLRRAIRAPDGMRLVCVDASQIEARMVGWLAGCRAIVDAFAAGRDLYSEFAAIVFGHPVNKKDNPVERQVGKVSILQLGYQSGAAKLQKKLEGSGIVVTIEEATGYVDAYRSTYSEIPRLWRGLERGLRETVRTGLSRHYGLEKLLLTKLGILLPSGRWLYYPMLREATEDEPANNVYQGQLVYWSAKYKMWKQLYGGSITENVIQAMARDVVTETHVTYIDDVVMQGHDELVQCVPQEIAPQRRLDTIRDMSRAPAWCSHPTMGLPPLAAEGYTSDCYSDTLT